MRPALIASDGMDLIDNNGCGAGQCLPTAFGGQQNIQRLGRGDQDMRWPAHHRLPFTSRRIAGAHRGANLGELQTLSCRALQNLAQRLLQVFLNIVAESLERRDIDHVYTVSKSACETEASPNDRSTRERRRAFCLSRWAQRLMCQYLRRYAAIRQLEEV